MKKTEALLAPSSILPRGGGGPDDEDAVWTRDAGCCLALVRSSPGPCRAIIWGAAFQFDLFTLPNLGSVGAALASSGITTGGITVVMMILFLEVTKPRSMRFQSRLHISALPELSAFIEKFAARRGWDQAMKDRLGAVAEETLLTLAPLDLEAEMNADEDGENDENARRLVVLASGEGPVAELEHRNRRIWRAGRGPLSNSPPPPPADGGEDFRSNDGGLRGRVYERGTEGNFFLCIIL